MTIIAAHRYHQGTPMLEALALNGAMRDALPASSFDWIGLHNPTPEELDLALHQYGLHPLAIEDALNSNQSPKTEVFGQQLFLVARTAVMEGADNIAYGQTAIFLGRDFLITARFGSERGHGELRRRLESDSQRLCEGPDFVAHAILDFIVDGYQPILDQLEHAVQTMEERAIDSFPDPATIRRIFRLRRQLRRFERIVGPMEEMCSRLSDTDLPAVDPSARIWFRDVLDHIRRTMARVVSLKETLATIVDTASLLEQHRQGEMTRQLAAWAAILAVPTAIAGIYGMNFDVMPELRWRYGYFAVWGLIAIICGGLWLRFRQIDWL